MPQWDQLTWETLYAAWKALADPAVDSDGMPVLDYSFDDGGARDLSGNGYDGIGYNILPSFGRNRRGLLLLGTGSHVLVPDTPQLRLAGGFTLQGWAYSHGLPRRPAPFVAPVVPGFTKCRNRQSPSERPVKTMPVAVDTLLAALKRLWQAAAHDTLDSVEARRDQLAVARFGLDFHFGLGRDQRKPVSALNFRCRQLLERLGMHDRIDLKQSPKRGLRFPFVPGLDVVLTPAAAACLPPNSVMAMPSLLCKVGSYGLDIDPATAQPYCVVASGKRLFTARAQAPMRHFTWVFVAATFDGHWLRLFVDGEAAAATAVSAFAQRMQAESPESDPAWTGAAPAAGEERALVDAVDSPLFVGEYPFDCGVSEGIIDEIRIYDFPRSPQAIRRDGFRARALAAFPFTLNVTNGFAGNGEYGWTDGFASLICEQGHDAKKRPAGKGPCLQFTGMAGFFTFQVSAAEARRQCPDAGVACDPAANSGSLTAQLWVRLQSLKGTAQSPLPHFVLFGHKTAPYQPLWLTLDQAGHVNWLVRVHEEEYSVKSPKPLAIDRWSHVAVTYDEFSGKLELRIDGRRVAGLKLPYRGCPLDIDWNMPFFVGAGGLNVGELRIAEIALYPFARTRAEIARDAVYYSVPCKRKEAGLLDAEIKPRKPQETSRPDRPQPNPGEHHGGMPGRGVIDCTRAICSDEQVWEWQNSPGEIPGDDLALPSGGRTPNCQLALCSEAAYAQWLGQRRQQQHDGAGAAGPVIDCSVATCSEEQSERYRQSLFERFYGALERAVETRIPPAQDCGALNCCVSPAAAATSSGSGAADGAAGSAPPPSNVTIADQGTVGTTIFMTGVTWKGGAQDGQPVTFEGTWTQYDEDGNASQRHVRCVNGACSSEAGPEAGIEDSGNAPQDSAADPAAPATDSTDDTPASGPPASPGAAPGGSAGTTGGGGTADSGDGTDPFDSGGSADGTDSGSGRSHVFAPDIDPLADSSRSAWDGWGGAGDFGFGSGTGLAGGGAGGGRDQGGNGTATFGKRDRGTISLRDTTDVLEDPSGRGTGGVGPGSGFVSPHGFLIPVVDLHQGVISNSYISDLAPGLLGGRLGLPDGRQSTKRVINDLLAEVSGRGRSDTKTGGLIGLLHFMFDDLVAQRPSNPDSDKHLEDALNLFLGFIPGVNDARDLLELVTCSDLATGEPLSPAQWAVTLAGVLFGSGAKYREYYAELKETLRKSKTVSGTTRREALAVTDEVLEKGGDLIAQGRLKVKEIPSGLQDTPAYIYQKEVTGGQAIEFEGVLAYDIPDMGPRRPRRGTVQIDGLELADGKRYLVEAKYMNPAIDFGLSGHVLNERKFIDHMMRLSDYMHQNQISGAFVKCNHPTLAGYYQEIVDRYSIVHRGNIVVELVP